MYSGRSFEEVVSFDCVPRPTYEMLPIDVEDEIQWLLGVGNSETIGIGDVLIIIFGFVEMHLHTAIRIGTVCRRWRFYSNYMPVWQRQWQLWGSPTKHDLTRVTRDLYVHIRKGDNATSGERGALVMDKAAPYVTSLLCDYPCWCSEDRSAELECEILVCFPCHYYQTYADHSEWGPLVTRTIVDDSGNPRRTFHHEPEGRWFPGYGHCGSAEEELAFCTLGMCPLLMCLPIPCLHHVSSTCICLPAKDICDRIGMCMFPACYISRVYRDFGWLPRTHGRLNANAPKLCCSKIPPRFHQPKFSKNRVLAKSQLRMSGIEYM